MKNYLSKLCFTYHYKCLYLIAGLAIQWGPIGDVGVFIDTVGGNETVAGGTMPQRILSCLESLDFLLHQKIPVVSSFVPAEKEQTEIRKTTDNLMQTICKIMGETVKQENRRKSSGILILCLSAEFVHKGSLY